jgi:hypothetical protein
MIIGGAEIEKCAPFLVIKFGILHECGFVVLGFLFLFYEFILFENRLLIMFIDILLIFKPVTNNVGFFIFELNLIKGRPPIF